LDGEEGFDVDFKQSAAGLSAEDLIAFANSPEGGAILIGVAEAQPVDGRRKGRVVGCAVGDNEKQIILGKAEACHPPVEVKVTVENAARQAFYRLEIPSSPVKPHCTAKGTYKTRGDARNVPLLPSRLLAMFVERQAREFVERFRAATASLESQLAALPVELDAVRDQVTTMIHELGMDVASDLQHVGGQAEDAFVVADATEGSVNEIYHRILDIETDVSLSAERVAAILQHLGIEDPARVRARAFVKVFLRTALQRNADAERAKLVEDGRKMSPVFSSQEISQMYDEVVEELGVEVRELMPSGESYITVCVTSAKALSIVPVTRR
jgi:ATP-dependent DNA helicase RecG